MAELWRGRVSVKGILLSQDRVLLIKTKRGTWDLPGGKLEFAETATECLQRECREELGILVEPAELVTCCVHPHFDDIFLVVFGCEYAAQPLVLSDEHTHLTLQYVAELKELGKDLPSVYAEAIVSYANRRFRLT